MDLDQYFSIKNLQTAAAKTIGSDPFAYMDGGSDDMHTLSRNQKAFQLYQLRPRRLVDVRSVDTQLNLFGKRWKSPLFLAPVGFQKLFYQDGALSTARGASEAGHLMIASTVTGVAFPEIAAQFPEYKPWFQLYPTTDRQITKRLIAQAEQLGSEGLVITADVPVLGNRETHAKVILSRAKGGSGQMGNLPDLGLNESFHDPSMTWEIIAWIRSFSNMKVIIKGIMTGEDAQLCLDYGADGVYISNHGGRQLDSNLSTIECLEEVASVIQRQIPIFIDGGFRRGTDVFKALALGANAVGIGRPYLYGLATAGSDGVKKALSILQKELERNMQLAGVQDLSQLDSRFVRKAPIIPN